MESSKKDCMERDSDRNKSFFYSPLRFLQPDGCRVATIFLHSHLPSEDLPQYDSRFRILQNNSVLSCAADSGANILHDHLTNFKDPSRSAWIPDLVCGDFDSIRPDVLQFYESKEQTTVIHTEDQDETDFTKALILVLEEIRSRQLDVQMIVAICNGTGRFDHMMGNANTLLRSLNMTEIPVVILSGGDLQLALGKPKDPYTCELHVDPRFMGRCCGIIPLCGPTRVSTIGLKWNLDDTVMEFGGLVSTSNEVVGSQVLISSDKPLLWTMEIKDCV